MNTGQWETRITLLQKLTESYDENAWNDFVRYYDRYIRMVLIHVGTSSNELDDITQEILLKLWKSLPLYHKQQKVKFRSWLSTVIRNCAINYFAKSNKQHKILDKLTDEAVNFKTYKEAELNQIIESEWKKYISTLAWKNLQGILSEPVVKVMELVMTGKDVPEIANTLSMKNNTVSVYKKRAIMALHREISRLDYELNN